MQFNGAVGAPVFANPTTGEIGSAPQTRQIVNHEAQVESFKPTSRKTEKGGLLKGDAKRGGRFLASSSVLISIGGIAAEIASMLAAISGAQTANKLNWPIASNAPWTWDKCEFLPNSGAPATPYGAGVSVFCYSLNVLVYVGMISYLIRFATFPVADYGIGVSGIFMMWLGLRLAARWGGTIQLIVGAFLMMFGLMNIAFNFDQLAKALQLAYSGEAPTEVQEKAAEQTENEKNILKARDFMRYKEAYDFPNGYAYGR